MNGYVNYFNSNDRYINLSVHVEKFLKLHYVIWDNISNLLKKGFDREPEYNDKYIKTNIKIYNNRINTNF